MKVIALVVFALAIFGANADVPSDVSNAIKKVLEKIPEPLLDLHDVHKELDLKVEKVDFNLKDLVIKGIKKLDIVTLDFDVPNGRLNYVLDFTAVNFLVDFIVKLSGLFDIDHHPNIRMDLSHLKLTGYAVVDSSAKPAQVTDLSVLVTVDGAKFELTNVLNDKDLSESLGKLLNEVFPDSFNAVAKDLEPIVSPIVQSIVNIVLRHV